MSCKQHSCPRIVAQFDRVIAQSDQTGQKHPSNHNPEEFPTATGSPTSSNIPHILRWDHHKNPQPPAPSHCVAGTTAPRSTSAAPPPPATAVAPLPRLPAPRGAAARAAPPCRPGAPGAPRPTAGHGSPACRARRPEPTGCWFCMGNERIRRKRRR